VVLAREAANVADVAEDLGGQEHAQAVDLGQGAAGGGQRSLELGLVVGQAGIDAPQVAEQVAGQLAAAGGGRGGQTHAAQERGRLFGGQVGGGAAGDQVAQQAMQTVQDAGALAGQVVAAFGQQPQDAGLVLGSHRAQGWAVQGGLGDAGRIRDVGLAATAGRSSRARAARVAGTSRTCSPAAASCWAIGRPSP
jgi:hypothetical protein